MSSIDRMAGSHAAGAMNRLYRRQRHLYDLTRKYYLLGRDHLIDGLDPPPAACVLEIGCGTGRNLVAAARRYPSTQLFGLDISSEMLATGRARVAREGLGGRIRLAEGDATGFDAEHLFSLGRFDRIFLSYTLSMVPDWRTALAAGLDRLAPGGALSVVDFGQQENLPDWFRALLFAWLRRFHVTPRAELSREIAGLAKERGYVWRVGPLYRGYAWYGRIVAPGV